MLNVSGFKLRRTIEFDPKFMDPEYPFRWAGVYHLTGEFYDLRLYGVPFPKVKMVMLSLPEGSGIDELRDDVTLLFSGNETHVPARLPDTNSGRGRFARTLRALCGKEFRAASICALWSAGHGGLGAGADLQTGSRAEHPMIIPSEFTVVSAIASKANSKRRAWCSATLNSTSPNRPFTLLWTMDSGGFPDQRRRIPQTDRPSMQECCGIF